MKAQKRVFMIITILEFANEYAFPKLQVIGLIAVLSI